MKKLILIFIIFLAGCASTKISSFKDPVGPPVQYKRIFVVAVIPDVDGRKYLEHKVCDELEKLGYTGVPSIEYILPTRQYTAEDVNKIIADTKVDGVLLLELSGNEEKMRSTFRPVYNPSKEKYEYVSGFYNQPYLYFKMQLLDVRENRTIWTATSETKGNKYADRDDLLNSLSESTIESLKKDGVL